MIASALWLLGVVYIGAVVKIGVATRSAVWTGATAVVGALVLSAAICQADGSGSASILSRTPAVVAGWSR